MKILKKIWGWLGSDYKYSHDVDLAFIGLVLLLGGNPAVYVGLSIALLALHRYNQYKENK